MPDEFDKYENGAYHWNATHDSRFLVGYSPRLEARYELPLEFLRDFHDIDDSVGVDVGCGDGAFLHSLRQCGGNAVGVDLSQKGLALYRERAGNKSLPVVCGSVHDLPFDRTFDYATLIDVIEHLPDRVGALAEVASVLSSGGTCIITTPFAKGDGMESEYHVHEYTASELKTVLESVFDEVNVYGYGPISVERRYQESQFNRQLIRLRSRLGANPFKRRGRNPQKQQFRYLLGIGRLS